jgi:hypothetical protein
MKNRRFIINVSSILGAICLYTCADVQQECQNTRNDNRNKMELSTQKKQNLKTEYITQKGVKHMPSIKEVYCYNGYSEDERINAEWNDYSKYLKFLFINTKNGMPAVTKFAYRTFREKHVYRLYTLKYQVDVHLYDVIKKALGEELFIKIYRKPYLPVEKVCLTRVYGIVRGLSKDEYNKWMEDHPETIILDA